MSDKGGWVADGCLGLILSRQLQRSPVIVRRPGFKPQLFLLTPIIFSDHMTLSKHSASRLNSTSGRMEEIIEMAS